ncbi:thioredoxin-disulfide reductase [Bacillus sp. 1P10SD]|uniref:thioredoxin-disulfide reductase n=1 Tax=Bacillus sp. 1P10SD TaxID=3132265 RepID=UPI0039A4D089
MIYDCCIIGAGSAGLSSAIYTGRAQLSTILIDASLAGGQLGETELVENYPGFPEGIDGPELMARMLEQATKFGTEIDLGYVQGISKTNGIFQINKDDGSILEAKTVILATGSTHTKLGIPGEEEFSGRGVSYCATCDGAYFKDKELVVVGGGDAALDEGIFLTRYAKVTIVHRRGQLRASKILQERAFKNERINFIWNSEVQEIRGNNKVQSVLLIKEGKAEEIKTDGVFIYVGSKPNSQMVKNLPEILDENGYLITDIQMETPIKGLFAAGDLRVGSVRQAGSAVGDGITAAIEVQKRLENSN